MVVFAGQDGGPAGAADGVRDDTAVEADAFLGQAIDVGRFDELTGFSIGADGLKRVVVGKEEDDVGPVCAHGSARG